MDHDGFIDCFLFWAADFVIASQFGQAPIDFIPSSMMVSQCRQEYRSCPSAFSGISRVMHSATHAAASMQLRLTVTAVNTAGRDQHMIVVAAQVSLGAASREQHL